MQFEQGGVTGYQNPSPDGRVGASQCDLDLIGLNRILSYSYPLTFLIIVVE